MTLDLTKAPWPEWEEAAEPDDQDNFIQVSLLREEYAFARHRVNLHDELVREVERRLAYVERIEPNCQCRNCVYTRQLLARAKQGEGRVQG